ncbi:GNAT family N-acetyltransferase [Pseudoalteromonas prydzensis]|uniref:GNAT family N-acetyltransferase n=1 Tax=Pseudoalteromonas prydzensis TaxID=182141 RepID=UPI0024BC6F78|nr:GNAT family N-acetyltransferase [Pseudoalteromonas prydzensis]
MTIKLINDQTWSAVLKIQAQAYLSVEPESLAVLKSKWYNSPESCFVYQQDESIIGYLLAHAWHSDAPPKLFQPLPRETTGSTLFLHDLAVSKSALGRGVATLMYQHLHQHALLSAYQQIRLVALQNSVGFWQRQGFEYVEQSISSSYGTDAYLMQAKLY